MFNAQQLTQIAASAGVRPNQNIASAFAADAYETCRRYGLTTLPRVQIFVGLVAEETGFFTSIEENLHYSAQRAHEVWPRIFPTAAAAVSFAGNPRALANRVYGFRMGNQSDPDGGWKYRGRGGIQITGHDNYKLVGDHIGVDLIADPDALLRPQYLLAASAYLFGKYPNILALCDQLQYQKVWNLVGGGVMNVANHQHALALTQRYIKSLPTVTVVTSTPPAPEAPPPPASEVSVKSPVAGGSAASAVVQPAAQDNLPRPYGAPLDTAKLQRDLNALGYQPSLPGTTFYGPRTREAVKWFQSKHGLKNDGDAGKLTLDAIAAALKPPA